MQETAPIIILVGTQLDTNIGMAARAMLNCGLHRLRLVAPEFCWPPPDPTSSQAYAAAADADRVLNSAEAFPTLAAATADCTRVFATTARTRAREIPGLDIAQAVPEILAAPSTTALVFGPERSGLDNASLACADRLIHLPTNPEFSSLNLAQAVLLVAWELRTATFPTSPLPISPLTPAPKAELHAFLTRLESSLEAGRFFPAPDRRADTLQNLAAFFGRATPTAAELKMLHGVITSLSSTPRS